MIFAGLEIGMPSYFQREHVNLITTPDYEDAVINTALSALADVKKFEKPDWDNSVFDAIHAVPRASRHTIGIYNHPSRKDLNKDKDENYSDISIWNKTRLNVTALSGAPGHQKKKMIGSYEVKIRPIDRWDPAVAEVGGTWDRLLSEGMPIWGAIASSDYHNDEMDYPPCAFSRIHVKTPTRDYAGVMQGLKEGTFWADHGKLLNDYRFSITSGDQKAMAFPGGTLNLFGDNDVIFVDLEISPTSEYQQEYFYTEVITNCAREEVGTEGKLLAPGETKMRLMIPIDGANKTGEQCFLRSRVINESGEDNRLSAYSNPIFIKY
jgi:hypothetical protein